MVDILDEPIGDPAAINTLLMCDAARSAGVKVLLSGMGADELFGGYRKHLACVMAARYQKAPTVLRHGLDRGVDALPVTARGRGLRYARWAKRFLTFAELPEEEAFRRSYTLYDPPELEDLLNPDLGGFVTEIVDEHRADLQRHRAWRPREPHVPRGLEDVPSGTQPGLHGPREHGGVDRSSRPIRRPRGREGRILVSRIAKMRGRRQKVVLKDAAEDWLPDEIVNRPKASFSAPLRAWVAHELKDVVDEVLLRGELVSTGFV